MISCSVVGCTSEQSKLMKNVNSNLSFHKLPYDADMRKLWIDILGPQNFKSLKNITICSLHFDESSMDRTSLDDIKLIKGALPLKPILKNTSVEALDDLVGTTTPSIQPMLKNILQASNVKVLTTTPSLQPIPKYTSIASNIPVKVVTTTPLFQTILPKITTVQSITPQVKETPIFAERFLVGNSIVEVHKKHPAATVNLISNTNVMEQDPLGNVQQSNNVVIMASPYNLNAENTSTILQLPNNQAKVMTPIKLNTEHLLRHRTVLNQPPSLVKVTAPNITNENILVKNSTETKQGTIVVQPNYNETKMERKLKELKSRCDQMRLKIKSLKQQVRRKNRKIEMLEDVIKENNIRIKPYKSQKFITDSDMET